MTYSSCFKVLIVVTYKTQRAGQLQQGQTERWVGAWTDGWMDSWMKNTKQILEGRIQGRQTVEKLKDRWTDVLT